MALKKGRIPLEWPSKKVGFPYNGLKKGQDSLKMALKKDRIPLEWL